MQNEKHWILAVLDKRNWRFDIYNSMRKKFRDMVVINLIAHIRSVIPLLANKAEVLCEPVLVTPMDCRVVKGIPQQDNGVIVEYLLSSMLSPYLGINFIK